MSSSPDDWMHRPITPGRFAEALKGLPVSSLELKALELRNSISHLESSNEQLRPYAEGRETAVSSSFPQQSEQTREEEEEEEATGGGSGQQPDPVCVEAIQENAIVIARMQERLRLLRAEVESRGLRWAEFESKEDAAAATAHTTAEEDGVPAAPAPAPTLNGQEVNGGHSESTAEDGERTGAAAGTGSSPWTDGTFQTGVIRNGEVVMDSVPGQSRQAAAGAGAGAATTGGSISDEELRRRMEEQLGNLGDDDDGRDEQGGLYL